jgi:hypothetical protein
MPRALARPVFTAHVAHGRSGGSARCTARAARGLPGRPRPERPATAWRASARQSGHRSPGARRGAAGSSTTAVKAEQKAALEHPRRRGYPPGMWVEVIAHRSSLSTGRGRKTGSAAAFSDEARAPVAGGGPAMGRRRRVSGGGGAETTTAPDGTTHLARRRLTTAASARHSDSSGASLGQWGGGFGPGERAVEMACARQGEGADSGARSGGLSGRRYAVPTSLLRRASGAAFSVLKITPGRK